MSATERLHYDSLVLVAEATVVAHATLSDHETVVLDRSPFYPEAGGQMGDHGHLAWVDGGQPSSSEPSVVVDARLDDAGRVHHLLLGAAPPVGTRVLANVDGVRRRSHMALHTGQHALSRALLDLCAAETISSRLGASVCTIDVNRELSLEQLRPAEDLVNQLIDEDRPVVARFVDDAELARLPLRKPPPETDRVRIVEITGIGVPFDLTPCGGTHVLHTAQIGLVVITGAERYKGGTRVSFEAGPRARRWLREGAERLRALALELKCAPPEIASVVDGLRTKLDESRRETGDLRGRLADALAARLMERAEDSLRIVASLDDVDVALLRAVAERLATGARLVVLGAPSETGTALVITRGPDCADNAGELLRALAARHGGRGGGRPTLAEGRLPTAVRVEDDAIAASVPDKTP